MVVKLMDKKSRSLKYGIVSSGQAGGRLSSAFAKLGYPAIAINTALQDLEHIDLPSDCKLHLEYGLGGAAKELEIGRQAAEEHRDAIAQLISEQLDDSNFLIFCLSLGGGSGAGSASVLLDILSQTGKPVMVLAVLPMAHEDAKTKANALETLSVLASEASAGRICNLALIDNAKIETMYSEVSQLNFYSVSNSAIVSPLDAFNTLSASASPMKALDSAEFGKLMTAGGVCVYGEMRISEPSDDTGIADAVLANLNSNLLTGGFDLSSAKYAGFIVAATQRVWEGISANSITYAMAQLDEVCETPDSVFKGFYVLPGTDEEIRVYSMFSGLGLPDERLRELREEVDAAGEKVKEKEIKRQQSMKIGGDSATAAANKAKAAVGLKKSAFGNLMGAKKK